MIVFARLREVAGSLRISISEMDGRVYYLETTTQIYYNLYICYRVRIQCVVIILVLLRLTRQH